MPHEYHSDSPRTKSAHLFVGFKGSPVILLLACLLLFSMTGLTYSHAVTGKDTTSSMLLSVTKRILLKAAQVGLDEAGSRIMGSAWPYLKTALEPLFKELKRRIPAFSRLEDKPGAGTESLAKQVVKEISRDPSLQNMIIDGFANLSQGQRVIINQLGNIEKLLARQNQNFRDFETKTDQRLDEIISLLRELRRQPTTLDYTGGVTMYDIEGTWTMVKEDPPGCAFDVGSLGMRIESINAFEASGNYTLHTLPSNMQWLDPDLPDDRRQCVRFQWPNKRLQLYGTILRIPFTDDWYMTREVERSDCLLTLSWDDDQGVKRHWYFLKVGCR